MKKQLNSGSPRRLMYIENKDGTIEGAKARIGWIEFSKTGRTIYYRGLILQQGKGVRGNHFDVISGEEYWVSGVKERGSNAHPAERNVQIEIDPDAMDEYQSLKAE
jgi:hypothetical protein